MNKNELVSTEPKTLLDVSTAELKQALWEKLVLTAEVIAEMAEIIIELERRGEDLSEFRTATSFLYIRAVAGKTLLPQLVLRYMAKKEVMSNLMAMPLHEQQQIIKNPMIPVLIVGKESQRLKEIDLIDLDQKTVNQVFIEGKIRSEDEQLIYLSAKPKSSKRDKAVRSGKIVVDYENHSLKSGKTLLSTGEVLMGLSELAGPVEKIDTKRKDELQPVSFKVTEEELKRIRSHVRESGMDQSDCIRTWLRALGVI